MNAKQRENWGRDLLPQQVERIAVLLARSEDCALIVSKGKTVWTRYDDDICDQRTGQRTTQKARSAGGRKTQTDREIEGRLLICQENYRVPPERIFDLIAAAGDASEGFDPEAIEALADLRTPTAPATAPAVVQLTPPAPKAARPKRDRLAWVAVLRDWSAKHGRGTP